MPQNGSKFRRNPNPLVGGNPTGDFCLRNEHRWQFDYMGKNGHSTDWDTGKKRPFIACSKCGKYRKTFRWSNCQTQSIYGKYFLNEHGITE